MSDSEQQAAAHEDNLRILREQVAFITPTKAFHAPRTPEEQAAAEMALLRAYVSPKEQCYDCQQITSDYVLEARATSGDQFGESWSAVPIHADRRYCHSILRERYRRDDLKAAREAVSDAREALAEAIAELRRVELGTSEE